jgi:maltose O-acetyltransferase
VPAGRGTPGWQIARQRIGRIERRVIQRLRGELNVDRLVARGLRIGHGTFVARDAYIDPGHPWLISIGHDSGLSPRVIVLVHDASMKRHIDYTLIAPIAIGDRVFVGAGAIILPGTRIGDDSVIAAGAVVRGDIPPWSMVVGNPAKVVSDVRSVADWHRHAVAQAPVWPHEGWTVGHGITEERKSAQREALAEGISGYLVGAAADKAQFSRANSAT